MMSTTNFGRRNMCSRFAFSLCLVLLLVTGFMASGFLSRGLEPVHAAPPFAGESCATATVIAPASLPFTDEASTVGAANDIDPGPGGCTSGLGPEVVYSFTPSVTDTYVAGVTPTSPPGVDVSLYVVTNCANPSGSCVGGINARGFGQSEALPLTLNAGTTYFIVVDSPQENGQGAFHFALRRGLPANDSCASPTVIEPSRLPFQSSATTYGATNNSNPGTPCLPTAQSASGPDVVYQFTPASTQNYDFEVNPEANFDVSLYIVTSCGSGSCTGRDQLGGAGTEALRRNLTAGVTYFIIVDGGQGDFGDFTFTAVPTIQLAPAPPSNLTATAVSSTQIDLAWQDNANDELGFRINRSLDGSNFTEIASVGSNVTTFSDTGLTPETAYFYTVVAFNNFGSSAPSNLAADTTPPSPVPVFPVISVDPTSLDFGTVSSTLAATKTLTISNAGGSDLVITGIQNPSNPFSIVNKPQTPFSIAPGQNVVITVRFAPLTAQQFNGSLSIQSNDPFNPNVGVGLQGIGAAVPVPNLDLPTTIVDFVGSSSSTTYEIKNTGDADLVVSSITQPNSPFAITGIPALPKILKTGEKFTLTITFSPGAPGVFQGDFRIASNDPDSVVVVVRLRGVITSLPPTMPGLEFRKKAVRFRVAGSNVVTGAVMIVDGAQTFALTTDGEFWIVKKNSRSTPGNLKPKDIWVSSGSTHAVQTVNPNGSRTAVVNLTR